MQHLGTKLIETNRLILRQFTLDDADAMFRNWAGDAQVTQYLMWPSHESADVSRHVLQEWVSHYQETNYYHWAITFKEHGSEPIGSIAVVKQDDTIKMAHMGYCLGKAWWNKGIASEALSAIIAFLFTKVGLNRVEARHDPLNPNSGKVMLRCGMKHEGVMREADWNNHGICDASLYAILQKDYTPD